MKKLIPVLLIAAVFTGCKLFDELRTFNMAYSVDFTIPSSSVINLPISLPSPPITTNSTQKFEDEGIQTGWIESIKLNDLGIQIVNPSGEDFGFLNSVHIYISADGQSETLIASKSPVSENAGGSISLDIADVDLFPFISQANFSLRTEAVTDEGLLYDVDIRADMNVEVKATIPGT
ncbi:MAG: hypothetical protein ACI9CU_002270 [Polaribacter sp.]|jgi:hypothetical protein